MVLSSPATHASPQGTPTRPALYAAGWLVLFGAALTLAALAANPTLSHESIWGRDFRSFYESAAALAAGGDPYERSGAAGAVNVNLPHVIAFMVPLTFLSPVVAFVVWQAIQIGAWAFMVWGLFARGALRPTPETVAALVLFPGTLAQLALGQWAFALALLVALAWSAHRAGSPVRAGFWIGLATAIKPFVGLLALILAWRGQLRTAAPALGIAGLVWTAGLLWLGPEAYSAWREAVGGITWAAYESNASLFGLAERLMAPDLSLAVWLTGSAIVAVTTFAVSQRLTEDAGWWTMALTAALLISPLGWVYYGWIVAPSLLALRRWPLGLKAGLVLLWIPPGLLPALSTASAGLLLVWASLAIEAIRGSGRVQGERR